MLKIIYPVLDKEDKYIVIKLLYKYREKLKISDDELWQLSEMKPNKAFDSELIKNIISTELGKYTDEQIKMSFEALRKYVDDYDIEQALKLHILPDRLKKLYGEIYGK